MRNHILAAAIGAACAILGAASSRADIILDTNGLGGTGTNVVFNRIFNTNTILGTLNGQHDEVVRFRDLSGNGNFTGTAGQNGNDIKIFNTSDLDVTVFDRDNVGQLGVTREVFSLIGSGSVLFHVTALEADGSFQNFNFAATLKNGQNGFDFTAINGERIWDMDIVGGNITDFEHYRIDVNPVAVPGPLMGAGAPGLLAACLGLWGLHRRRRACLSV
jgi:hypothetical protein